MSGFKELPYCDKCRVHGCICGKNLIKGYSKLRFGMIQFDHELVPAFKFYIKYADGVDEPLERHVYCFDGDDWVQIANLPFAGDYQEFVSEE